ncbi:tax1-binding protein 1 homolog B isoform X2 [Amia ocellicauda]|uniref:tax1-binding protein 1 homolog B isoform X2 n=1 Tax=Amia ocellicauda TaxID=2972642 RepID=UPI0034649467
MAFFQEGSSPTSTMETSNFAHVIFQNVGKSYIPHAALECHYTLTQYIKPHQKDWVGIFKVGWSTARDYYTFLWSPLPDNYVEGTSVNRVLVFQGYYVPNDDGEFYQFCYVTHKGEIRGASTPFQFRASTPTDELLTMEDENNSDILVVTTKAGFLEHKIEEANKEKQELLKVISELQKENDRLQEETTKLEKLCEEEKETCAQLRKDSKDLHHALQALKDEKEEIKKKFEEAKSRVIQLEEDLIGVTEKGIEKETELDSIRDRMKKLTLEKENLELQLKNEKDEKELYKIHLKNTELENTKLTAEIKTLKAADVNKENMLTQLKEEVGNMKMCLSEKEKLQREILTNTAPKGEIATLREQLRKTEEQLQATRQEASMLSAELRDVSSARDKTMSDLYRTRLEVDALKMNLSDAVAECSQKEGQLQKMRAAVGKQDAGEKQNQVEQELHREVEDLKLRLQMAADHYREKYKECQKLQKQVLKLSDQGESKKAAVAFGVEPTEASHHLGTAAAECSPPGSPGSSDIALDPLIPGKPKGTNKDLTEKSERYKKCKVLLAEEKERSSMYADELAKMELKLKEQLKVNESLRLQLAAEEDRYKSQVAEKGRELKELKENLAVVVKEKEEVEEELKKTEWQTETCAAEKSKTSQPADGSPPVYLQYPIPYSQEPPAPLVPICPPDLHYGNPYSTQHIRDGADGEFSSDKIHRPPVGPPSWDSNVVCIQPARNLSRPDGLEDPEELSNGEDAPENLHSAARETPTSLLRDGRAHFCFDSSIDVHKRCPLCEVIFPPNYDQSKFEEHVESHWKVCPMCNEQFPLDCDQQLFERHVLIHFDGNPLNFE